LKKSKGTFYLYTTKVICGTVLGIIFGMIRIEPLIGWVIMILGLIPIVILFKYGLKLDEKIILIALWHGTFSYFISTIAFWSLIHNVLYSKP